MFCEQCRKDLGSPIVMEAVAVEAVAVEMGDQIAVAEAVVVAEPVVVAEAAPPRAAAPPAAEPAAPASALPARAKPKLVVVRGQKVGVEFPIYGADMNFIGRADEKPSTSILEEQEPPDRIHSSRACCHPFR